MLRRRRVSRGLSVALVIGLFGSVGVGVGAAFRSTSSNTGAQFAAAPDYVAPAVPSAVVAKTTGYRAAFLKQNGTYRVYANVTDTGNPASGTNLVTANVSTITTAGTAVALVAGAYTAEGVSYNYRSGSLTALTPLSEGAKAFTISTRDVALNTRTQSGFSATVDNTAPTGTDVQATNGGATAGRPEAGDVVTLTYSDPIDPQSILAGWTGSATSVVVRVNNASPDALLVYNAANTAQLPLGSVNLGRTDYVTASRTFGVTGTASTMVMSGAVITLTLGTASGAGTTAAATGTSTWTPSATGYDRAGNVASTAVATETGAADKEF